MRAETTHVSIKIASVIENDLKPESPTRVTSNRLPFIGALPPAVEDTLWAKTNLRDKSSQDWGLLTTHMCDSGLVSGWLWDHWASPMIKSTLARGLNGSETYARKVAVFLAAVHDVGKASPAFVAKVAHLSAAVEATGALHVNKHLGKSKAIADAAWHGIVGYHVLRRMIDGAGNQPTATARAYAAIVGAHHGNFPGYDQGRAERTTSPHGRDTWIQAQDRLVVESRRLARFTKAEWEHFRSTTPDPAIIPVLTGLVVMSDWLASNLTLFPLGSPPPKPSSDRLLSAMEALQLEPQMWEPQHITAENLRTEFSCRFGDFDPRPAQSAVVKHVAGLANPASLLILEAPTGVGKTEAALLAAEMLARRTGASGITVALPTRATSDAMYSRVGSWLSTLPGGDKLAAALTHGKAQFNTEYTSRLEPVTEPGTDVYDEDDCTDCAAQLHHWFAGARERVLADFTVGTIDQVLLYAAASKHFSVRHLGLAGKVLVLDEVHASDTYMNTFLRRSLRWLGKQGVPVVALTATLTPSLRQELHSAYSGSGATLDPKIVNNEILYTYLDFPEARKVSAYPVITSSSPGESTVTVDTIPKGRKRTVRVEVSDLTTPVELSDHLLRTIGRVGCGALVLNTVRRAQEAYEHLRSVLPEDQVILLHSRFTGVRRGEIEAEVKKLFGKGSDHRPRRFIVVSTQIVEQSLDLDFDVMLSDLAPIDLLVQRMGRVHRHDRPKRPRRHRIPKLIVGGYRRREGTVPAIESSFLMYARVHLLRTAAMLEARTSIAAPHDLPGLMRELDEGGDVPPGWETEMDAAWSRFVGDEKKAAGKANLFTLSYPEDENPVPWKRTDLPPISLTVRDSTPSVEVVIGFNRGGTLCLPDDGGPESGKQVTGFIDDDLGRAIAQRLVSLPPSVSNYLYATFPKSGSAAKDFVPECFRNGTRTWGRSGFTRGLGLMVLTPDAMDPETGRGSVSVGPKIFQIEYSPRTGLKIL